MAVAGGKGSGHRDRDWLHGDGHGLAVYTDAIALGGAERGLETLVEALDSSFDVTVVGVDRGIVEELAAARPGSRSRVIRSVRDKRDLRGIGAHIRTLGGLGAEVLIANMRHPWSCQYALLAGLLVPGLRTIGVQHMPVPPSNRRQLVLTRAALRRVDAHVANSRYAADELERIVGLPSGTVIPIHNGVADINVEARERTGSGPVIGAVGRYSPEKGYDVLIRAVAEIAGAELVLVGDGPEHASLMLLARELGIEDRVEFTGWLREPRRLLPTFDVFAAPSRLEAHGISVVEAMLASRAVVAAAVGGIPESVVDGETGLLVPPDDPVALRAAVESLLTDPGRRSAMGAAGRMRALETFNVERMVGAYERTIAGVLSGTRTG